MQHVWGELILTIRSSSKAVLIPLILFRVTASWHPSLSAILVLSYLGPWMNENLRTYHSLNRAFKRPRDEGRPLGMMERQGVPARGRGLVQNICRNENDETPVSQFRTMAALKAAIPDRIFLNEGGVCPVCL
eukprot:RCo049103